MADNTRIIDISAFDITQLERLRDACNRRLLELRRTQGLPLPELLRLFEDTKNALSDQHKEWRSLERWQWMDGEIRFWLNPTDQENYRSGWFSIDDLIAWLSEAGPIVMYPPEDEDQFDDEALFESADGVEITWLPEERPTEARLSLVTADLVALGALVGAPVVAAERARWGFENHTEIVTLAGGKRLVVQRITRRAAAQRRIALAGTLPPLLAIAGIRAPALLAASAHHTPPYLVREFLPGEPANTLLASPPGALRVAHAMGALLPRLAAIPTAGARLPAIWASPARLAARSRQRLAACAAMLGAPTMAALGAVIGQLPALFAARPAVLAHGDYCPVNALVLADAPALQLALIDFDEARLADSLYDAAWWGWVVRFHHPEHWHAAWPALLAAAGVAWDANTAARVRALQMLRLLEALDDAQRHAPAAAAGWAERLHATLAWAR